MNLELDQKKFLVTGATRGIGKAISNSLLREGAYVGLIARGQEQLVSSVDELQKNYGKEFVFGWSADCVDETALKKLRKQIMKKWERIDGVIANVGDGRSIPDEIPDSSHWSKIWNINFETAINTARVFLPLLKESKGSLLFISSITGLEVIGAPIDYSTAKTAVIAFAKNLARKVAPEVRVNVIAPGNVHFPGSSWEEKIKTDSKKINLMLQEKVSMKRFGTPEEISDAAVFLCSARASFITGSVMVVDGGQTVGLF
jgi:3-oxoacyl-[acyl-carrier protein] reductase